MSTTAPQSPRPAQQPAQPPAQQLAKPPAQQPPGQRPGASRPALRGREGAVDMVRSMLVVLALVAVVVLLFARPRGQVQRPFDLAGTVASASAAGLPVSAPDLPRGWRPTNARFAPDTEEGLPTWHVGYLTPSDTYAGVDVTRGSTPRWLAGVLGDDLAEDGHRRVGGATWTVYGGGSSSTAALVRTTGQVTTAVSGAASARDLGVLAAALTR